MLVEEKTEYQESSIEADKKLSNEVEMPYAKMQQKQLTNR
jgi:hypothetical protein